MITRSIAIIPAAIVAILYGESGTAKLLVLSQVVLSMQLSFAVFPLEIHLGSRKDGGVREPDVAEVAGLPGATVIAGLNIWLLLQFFAGA